MERRAFRVSGFLVLLVLVVIDIVCAVVTVKAASTGTAAGGVVAAVGVLVFVLVTVVLASGFVVISPNEARVLQFFGRYIGTIGEAGFHWTVPFTMKRRLSQRVANFESARLKVSDAD